MSMNMKSCVVGWLLLGVTFVDSSFTFIDCALGDLNFELAWKVESKEGFSGPNEIRDMTTGKTRGIVVCDVGAGIVCFAPDGERLWEYALKPPVTAYPAVGDVDGDGTEEVVACGGQGTVAVLDAAGRLKWTAHTPGSVGAESCPSVADLDGDGKQKIPADRHVEFRRAVSVPTLRSERVADALPLLDQGRLLTVASMESDDWALYPYDEPSSPYAKTTLNLVEVARLVRQADPNILIYTDPTSGTTMETVKMLTGLIDIWCPSDELLDRFGDELVPEAKRVGKEVWFYAAAGRARTLSCLGVYRWRFWHAWNMGFTGVGWWTYQYGDHSWEGRNPGGDYFCSVYRAPGAIVTSKRWEVAREGVEDYELLYLLRDAIERAKQKNVSHDALSDAERLLIELPREVAAALQETGRRLPLTPESVPAYRRATEFVRDARHRIVQACLRVNELAE